jgi:hypothetical protein
MDRLEFMKQWEDVYALKRQEQELKAAKTEAELEAAIAAAAIKKQKEKQKIDNSPWPIDSLRGEDKEGRENYDNEKDFDLCAHHNSGYHSCCYGCCILCYTNTRTTRTTTTTICGAAVGSGHTIANVIIGICGEDGGSDFFWRRRHQNNISRPPSVPYYYSVFVGFLRRLLSWDDTRRCSCGTSRW